MVQWEGNYSSNPTHGGLLLYPPNINELINGLL